MSKHNKAPAPFQDRQRERDRERDRQTDRERERQTDRERERQTERERERQRERDRERGGGAHTQSTVSTRRWSLHCYSIQPN